MRWEGGCVGVEVGVGVGSQVSSGKAVKGGRERVNVSVCGEGGGEGVGGS